MDGRNGAKQLPLSVCDGWWGAVCGLSGFVVFLAFTGALFRMHLGLQGLAGGFVFGTVFG